MKERNVNENSTNQMNTKSYNNFWLMPYHVESTDSQKKQKKNQKSIFFDLIDESI